MQEGRDLLFPESTTQRPAMDQHDGLAGTVIFVIQFDWSRVFLADSDGAQNLPLRISVRRCEYMMTGTESMSAPPKIWRRERGTRCSTGTGACVGLLCCVHRSLPQGIGRDLLIAEPGTEKECPRRLVRTDYRASDPKTPVRIRARALRGEPGITRVLAEIFRDFLVPAGIRRRLRRDPFGNDRRCRRIVPPR